MRNFWTILCVLIVIVLLVLSSVMFQVRETDIVIVERFGKPIRQIEEPGLKFKYPIAIDVVRRFDKRSRLFQDTPEEETATAGGEPIIVKSFVVWKIDDAEKFLVSVKTVENAESNLMSLLRDKQNSVIGRHYFSEFVNTDPEKIKFKEIEDEIAAEISQKAMDEYGIAIQAVGIKRLLINKSTTEKVFNRMKADRNRKTVAILAAGNAKAEDIKSDADAKQKELLAVADNQAKQIRADGDAQAAKYYKMLERDPDLAMFLRDLEALKTILSKRSTIILGVETEPIHLLKELPDIKPKNSNSEAGN